MKKKVLFSIVVLSAIILSVFSISNPNKNVNNENALALRNAKASANCLFCNPTSWECLCHIDGQTFEDHYCGAIQEKDGTIHIIDISKKANS